VATHNDGLGPAGNTLGDILHDDGFAEDGTAADVADSAVGRLPHFLEVELLHAGLIGGDGGALDTDLVFLDGVGRIYSDLIISCITVFHAKIVIPDVNIQMRKDKLQKVKN
jgi:hypothetical protein